MSATTTHLTDFTDQYAPDFKIWPDGRQIIFARPPAWFKLADPIGLLSMRNDGSNLELFAADGSPPA